MHPTFLKFLRCPISGEPLKVREHAVAADGTVISGELFSSTNTYPIVDKIPRFIAYKRGNYASSFGTQWKRWPRVQYEDQNIRSSMKGHTTHMFKKIIGEENYCNFSNKLILDVGVGAGRFANVALGNGAKVIAIDLSDAVEVARANNPDDEKMLVCQGDALNLPLAENVVDGVYSIGVLHHTPDPQKGLSEMFRVVNANGWISLAVYGKGGYYDSLRVTTWRFLFKHLTKLFKSDVPVLLYSYLCAYLLYYPSYIPGIGHAIRATFPMIRLPDVKWRLLDTYDSVTPCFQSAHTREELFSWFSELGLLNIVSSDWGTSSMRAVKQGSNSIAANV